MAKTTESLAPEKPEAKTEHTEVDHFAEGGHRFLKAVADTGSYSGAMATLDDAKTSKLERQGFARTAAAYAANSDKTPAEVIKLARQAVKEDEEKKAAKAAAEARQKR